ncbi:MAG: hypothetical protein JXM70_18125 [Pirellulales bacterium]|nr:hypothetical protein [Pirellulales bacterium]
MPLKLLNISLLIAAIIGGFYTYRANRQYRQLKAEVNRLSVEVGDLDVADPSKAYVEALPTGEPLHFAWRVYLPANFQACWKHTSGSSWSTNSEPSEFLSRVRIIEDDKGQLLVYHKEHGGSGKCNLGSTKLAKLLRGRWNEIHVEQLGSDGIAVVDPNDISVLLRLTLSDELKIEAQEKLNKYENKQYQKELFGIRFGSRDAFAADQ